MSTEVRLHGQLERWPSMAEMARLLDDAGLQVVVGKYSLRLTACEHFVIQNYGGDIGLPQIEADAETMDRMADDSRRVSAALAAADLRHRFEVYDDDDTLVAYLHHRWPQGEE